MIDATKQTAIKRFLRHLPRPRFLRRTKCVLEQGKGYSQAAVIFNKD